MARALPEAKSDDPFKDFGMHRAVRQDTFGGRVPGPAQNYRVSRHVGPPSCRAAREPVDVTRAAAAAPRRVAQLLPAGGVAGASDGDEVRAEAVGPSRAACHSESPLSVALFGRRGKEARVQQQLLRPGAVQLAACRGHAAPPEHDSGAGRSTLCSLGSVAALRLRLRPGAEHCGRQADDLPNGGAARHLPTSALLRWVQPNHGGPEGALVSPWHGLWEKGWRDTSRDTSGAGLRPGGRVPGGLGAPAGEAGGPTADARPHQLFRVHHVRMRGTRNSGGAEPVGGIGGIGCWGEQASLVPRARVRARGA
eukprot:scaffold7239_cov397-Prasinococcus_capsulatus_cf.AAC.2